MRQLMGSAFIASGRGTAKLPGALTISRHKILPQHSIHCWENLSCFFWTWKNKVYGQLMKTKTECTTHSITKNVRLHYRNILEDSCIKSAYSKLLCYPSSDTYFRPSWETFSHQICRRGLINLLGHKAICKQTTSYWIWSICVLKI